MPMLTRLPTRSRISAILALALLLASLAAFFYSLRLRRRDWSAAPRTRLTTLIPPPPVRL